MKKFILLLVAQAFLTIAQSQDAASLIQEAHSLIIAMKEEQAFEKIKEVLKVQPANMEALVISSELCSNIGSRQPTKDAKMSYYRAAESYANTAIKVDSTSSQANVALSIAKGRMALTTSGKEKVDCVKGIKEHAETALRLDPNNFKAMHVLGKWHYEVSRLNPVEKAALKVLYGGIPKATIDESIGYYERAKKINPNFLLNYLELSKAYVENHQSDMAIEVLNRMLKLPNKSANDPILKEEARKYLQTLL